MDDSAKIQVCLQYLRRTYYLPETGLWDVATLRTLATTAFTTASKEVTITGTGSELGNAQGVMKFDKMILVAALETLLLEVDPDNVPPPPPTGYSPDFGCRSVQV